MTPAVAPKSRVARPRWVRPVLATALIGLAPAFAFAYGNDRPGDDPGPHGGGPHRRINALALERFVEAAAADPILMAYDFHPSAERYGLPPEVGLFWVEGRTVTRSGAWNVDEELMPGSRATRIAEGDVAAPFRWWVEEGGYTADEPESFMALRHFYDPLGLTTDLSTGAQVSYLTDLEHAALAQLVMGVNPRMNAANWAFTASPWSYSTGEQALEAVGGKAVGDGARRTLYATAWRCLGETMHLLSDMTVPAHVRNDSHPGYAIRRTLKGDPYEDFVDEAAVALRGGRDAPAAVRNAITAAASPRDLFRTVASYTNAHFFSKDTVSGKDPVSGAAVSNANGQPGYPSPRLEDFSYAPDTGFYHEADGLTDVATRLGDGSHTISSVTAATQADALVPTAVEGCARLLYFFLPRVRVVVDGYDATSGVLRFHANRWTADATGAFLVEGPPVDASSSPFVAVFVRVGSARRAAAVRYERGEDGGLRASVGPLLAEMRGGAPGTAPADASCQVGLDMGGIFVRSAPLPLDAPTKPPPPPPGGGQSWPAALRSSTGVLVEVDGSWPCVEVAWMGPLSQFKGGNFDFFTRQRESVAHPLRWVGASFSASYSYDEKREPTWANPDTATRTSISVQGEVSPDGRTLVSLSTITVHSTSVSRQEHRVQVRGVPLLPQAPRDDGRFEAIFSTAEAGGTVASYAYRETGAHRVAPDHTASTGRGTFKSVRVWFR